MEQERYELIARLVNYITRSSNEELKELLYFIFGQPAVNVPLIERKPGDGNGHDRWPALKEK